MTVFEFKVNKFELITVLFLGKPTKRGSLQYDSVNFDIKTPIVLCICHKDIRGSFTTFLANLIDGLPTSKYFKKGFKKKYDLHNVNLLIDEITSYKFESYNSIIRSELDLKPDLAIIEIPNEFRDLEDVHNVLRYVT